MNFRTLIVAGLFSALAGAASAQTAQPATGNPLKPAVKAEPAKTEPAKPAAATAPTKPAPAAAPAAAAKPAVAPAPAAAAAGRINLNTASAEDLDKLPQIGPARAKAIVEARAKGKFKNWDDFVARKVVPANAVTAIKDRVSF